MQKFPLWVCQLVDTNSPSANDVQPGMATALSQIFNYFILAQMLQETSDKIKRGQNKVTGINVLRLPYDRKSALSNFIILSLWIGRLQRRLKKGGAISRSPMIWPVVSCTATVARGLHIHGQE